MADPVLIPTRPDLRHYDIEVTLDDANYVLEFTWSVREACWYLSLYLPDGTPLLVGRKIVIGWPITARLTPKTPPGTLIAWDTSGSGVEAREDDLGTRIQLQYWPKKEAA